MFSDNHVHSSFSPDGTASMETMIRSAISKNFRELVITDHLDFDFPNPEFSQLNLEQYVTAFQTLKAKYEKNIQLRLGIEIGIQSHVTHLINQVLEKFPFDFVIGSTHTVYGISCSSNEFFDQTLTRTAYLRYFEGLLSNIKHLNNYDVCGHLDFIARYNPRGSKELFPHDFAEILDTILKTIIETGHGIELNTAGYLYGLNRTHPSLDVLQRYRALGGEIITVGSDAHAPEHIGANFNLAYQLLKAADFNYITQFKERKPSFIKIDKLPKEHSNIA
ncbi:histidinol-phosphatase HisJ family protein [Dehalobacterium formicoaceticum]|uniref:Histidinol-phosphatase n=1 Tax=Dehalobacterium formicoaceticum TaxID=51515 RepID=A0ABT1Y1K0_9FIRM|nr:histidinol-phosphatase HisJ family protein [Dehalobacterium formicoaceticum]MCR6544433.1 histidinol-phosphatase HisJ family protein [Dehalobacterium formicoaceticum]